MILYEKNVEQKKKERTKKSVTAEKENCFKVGPNYYILIKAYEDKKKFFFFGIKCTN